MDTEAFLEAHSGFRLGWNFPLICHQYVVWNLSESISLSRSLYTSKTKFCFVAGPNLSCNIYIYTQSIAFWATSKLVPKCSGLTGPIYSFRKDQTCFRKINTQRISPGCCEWLDYEQVKIFLMFEILAQILSLKALRHSTWKTLSSLFLSIAEIGTEV